MTPMQAWWLPVASVVGGLLVAAVVTVRASLKKKSAAHHNHGCICVICRRYRELHRIASGLAALNSARWK